MFDWCKRPEPSLKLPKEDKESISTLVYHELEKQLKHYGRLDVWLSNNYNAIVWVPRFDEQQSKIDKIADWASNLPSGEVKNQYLQWIEYYYQWGLDEAREELHTKKEKHHMDAYKTNEKRRQEAVNNHPDIPKPPK